MRDPATRLFPRPLPAVNSVKARTVLLSRAPAQPHVGCRISGQDVAMAAHLLFQMPTLQGLESPERGENGTFTLRSELVAVIQKL